MHWVLIFITSISPFTLIHSFPQCIMFCKWYVLPDFRDEQENAEVLQSWTRDPIYKRKLLTPSVQAFLKIIYFWYAKRACELPRPLKVGADRHAPQNINRGEWVGIDSCVWGNGNIACINHITIFVHNSAILNKPPGYLRPLGLLGS